MTQTIDELMAAHMVMTAMEEACVEWNMVEAGQLAEDLLDIIKHNSVVTLKPEGYFYTIKARDILSGVRAWFLDKATSAATGLDAIQKKAQKEEGRVDDILVENEIGIMRRERYELASKIYVDEVLLEENDGNSYDALAKAAVTAADVLLYRLERVKEPRVFPKEGEP